MRWNVAQLLKSPIGTERRYTLDDDGREIEGLVADVTGSVRLLRTDRAILVYAKGGTAVRCTCSRCLEDFAQPVTFDMEEEFFPKVDVQTGVRLAEPEDSSAFTIDVHHVLDLTEAVRQYTLLNLPMNPLCSQECPGLSGDRLKDRACGSPSQPVDPRWAKLHQVRPHLGSAT